MAYIWEYSSRGCGLHAPPEGGLPYEKVGDARRTAYKISGSGTAGVLNIRE